MLPSPASADESEPVSKLSDMLNAANAERQLSSRQIEAEAARHGHRISFSIASRYLRGDHPSAPSSEVVRALAAVFHLDPYKIRKAAGLRPVTGEPLELPEESAQLTTTQRQIVRSLVLEFARANDLAGGHDT